MDAGTIELLRRFGVEIVSSADLVQHFEAVWSPEQLQTHLEAEPKMRRIVDETFAEIARCVASGRPTDEYRPFARRLIHTVRGVGYVLRE